MTRTVIGLMSGTSLDGVDAALLRTDGRAAIEPGKSLTQPYDDEFRAALRMLLGGEGDVAAVEAALTERHAAVVTALLEDAGVKAGHIDLIGFHGQTIAHEPANGLTRQIGDGALLARLTAIDVVDDFRSADVAAGGEGAPLAPLYHAAIFAGEAKPLAVLNIGGVANVTWIGPGYDPRSEIPDAREILAFDTGPGNAPIDDLVRERHGHAYDEGGALALDGAVNGPLLDALMENPYFERPPPKSADRQDFAVGTGLPDDLATADHAATLVAFAVAAVVKGSAFFPAPAVRWLVTGGGRHNRAMLESLADRLDAPVEPVEAAGWDGDVLEAQAFAYLAVRSVEGLPLSLPTTTGVRRPVTGGRLHRAPARRQA